MSDNAGVSREAASFRENDYVVARKVLDEETLGLLETYFLLRRDEPGYYDGTRWLNRYADSMTESLLLELKPLVERRTGYALLPTYSFARIYQRNAALERHTDRPACEITGTMTIAYDAPEVWPIFVERNLKQVDVPLDRGDMMIYRGTIVPHGRGSFRGEYWLQVFLSYVIDGGELAEYRYDGRPRIGVIPESFSQKSNGGLFRKGYRYARSVLGSARQGFRERKYLAEARNKPALVMDYARYSSYAGMYKVGEHRVVKIEAAEDGILAAAYEPGRRLPRRGYRLFAETENDFFARDANCRVTFVRDEHGAPTELVLRAEGSERRGRKISY